MTTDGIAIEKKTPPAKSKITKRYAVLKFRGKSKANGRLVVTQTDVAHSQVAVLRGDGETIDNIVMVKFIDGKDNAPFGVHGKNLVWCKVGR